MLTGNRQTNYRLRLLTTHILAISVLDHGVCLFLFLEWVGDFHKNVSGSAENMTHALSYTVSQYDDRDA
jgi:hypothetical protein